MSGTGPVGAPHRRPRPRHRFTSRADGDLAYAADPAPVRARLSPYPWTYLHQVHGADVVTVEEPGQHTGADADAAVTRVPGAVLAVHTADCAPVALLSPQGVVGAAHAGWRGLEAGVLEATVAAMRALGAEDIHAVLGPCIRPECYEFGKDDLDRLAERYGDGVRGVTSWGTPALDVPAGVRAALAAAGVGRLDDEGACTACDDRWFSHRARAETGRQALLVWLEP
ncbi:MAG TPA: polyphenol oxidase family protein [Acidimicrobiales bacterium]